MSLTVERSTRVPRDAAFAWFTDFSPADTELVSMLHRRDVQRVGKDELVVENTIEVDGQRSSNLLRVRLDPPRGYDAQLDLGDGGVFLLRFDLLPQPASTLLRVTVQAAPGASRPERAEAIARGIGRNIDELFPAMERELGFG
jgi:hypothetical protein